MTIDGQPEHSQTPESRPALLALVMVGGAVGTLLRSLLEATYPDAPGTWPWTTFGINVAGSFILALLLTALTRSGPDVGWRRNARLGAGTGFCGGFTTYSTFVVQVDTLLRDGWVLSGLSYALMSVVVGIAAAVVGMVAARRWLRPPSPVVP